MELSRWSSLTDHLVRKFKDGSGINITMKNSSFSYPYKTLKQIMFVPVQQYKHHVRSIARSGVTTDAKPQAQQQLARFLEVERAVMGQRCRPQSFGEVQRCITLFFL